MEKTTTTITRGKQLSSNSFQCKKQKKKTKQNESQTKLNKYQQDSRVLKVFSQSNPQTLSGSVDVRAASQPANADGSMWCVCSCEKHTHIHIHKQKWKMSLVFLPFATVQESRITFKCHPQCRNSNHSHHLIVLHGNWKINTSAGGKRW